LHDEGYLNIVIDGKDQHLSQLLKDHVPIGTQQVSLVKAAYRIWELHASPNADPYENRVLELKIG
jgi:hypothetical protein